MAQSSDLACYDDLSNFVRAQACALAALDRAVKGAHDLISSQLARALEDLRRLGTQPAQSRIPVNAERLEETGITYVIAGAHLGAKTLARHVASSDDPRVRPLKLFQNDALPAAWQELVAALKCRPAYGAQSDRVVVSALECFSAFRAAFETHMTRGLLVDD